MGTDRRLFRACSGAGLGKERARSPPRSTTLPLRAQPVRQALAQQPARATLSRKASLVTVPAARPRVDDPDITRLVLRLAADHRHLPVVAIFRAIGRARKRLHEGASSPQKAGQLESLARQELLGDLRPPTPPTTREPRLLGARGDEVPPWRYGTRDAVGVAPSSRWLTPW